MLSLKKKKCNFTNKKKKNQHCNNLNIQDPANNAEQGHPLH